MVVAGAHCDVGIGAVIRRLVVAPGTQKRVKKIEVESKRMQRELQRMKKDLEGMKRR